MPTSEKNLLMRGKDSAGNTNIFYPITKAENVDGLEEAIAAAGGGGSGSAVTVRKNLLDNWYFVGGGTPGKFPINQRGQTVFDTDAGVYKFIDRWFYTFEYDWSYSTCGKLELVQDGIKFSSMDANELHKSMIRQRIARPMAGKTLAASVLVNGQLISRTVENVQAGTIVYFGNITGVFPQLYVGEGDDESIFSVEMYGGVCGADGFTISAVKLEEGSEQTLAHQDEQGNWVLNEQPDYREQMDICTDYLCVLSTDETGDTHLSTKTLGATTFVTAPDGRSYGYLSLQFPKQLLKKPSLELALNGAMFCAISTGGGTSYPVEVPDLYTPEVGLSATRWGCTIKFVVQSGFTVDGIGVITLPATAGAFLIADASLG